jgi:hypothetical protein
MQWNKSLHGKLKATGTSAGLRKLIFGRLIRIKARSGFAHLHTVPLCGGKIGEVRQ